MPVVEQRHFEVIAEIIRNARLTSAGKASMAEIFADGLSRYNPRFKRSVFMRACGFDDIFDKENDK